jgi:hypothetical protein
LSIIVSHFDAFRTGLTIIQFPEALDLLGFRKYFDRKIDLWIGVLLTKLNKQPGRHLEIGGKGLIVLINVNYCCPALDIR